MRSKMVWRYYCDHCKKSGCGKSQMKTHEAHCTMNPNRKCRMCEFMGNEQVNTEKLVGLIPKAENFANKQFIGVGYPGLQEAFGEALIELRKLTNNCPACILAALRQGGFMPYYAKGFDYAEEVRVFWDRANMEEIQ